MRPNFPELVARMEPLLQQLQASESFLVGDCGKFPKEPGVYLLIENEQGLYVGRTKCLRDRMRGHGSKSHYSASFALKLARLKANKPSTYSTEDSAKTLMRDEVFKAIFHDKVRQVKSMKAKFVVLSDDHAQYLFEMYASLMLEVPHCDFATH